MLSVVFTIDRLDFGLGPNGKLPDGTEIIGNEVVIEQELPGIANLALKAN